MKFLHLMWRNIMRRKMRSIFTILSIAVAFVLFAFLSATRAALTVGVEFAGEDRLIMTHKVSLIQLLPLSYLPRIKGVAGVTDATHQTWFGGYYQDPLNFFANMPVEPEPFLKMYPEFLLPEAQKKAWLADRTGAIIGRDLAARFGWKIGDRIPLQATIWTGKGGARTWELNIVGIYDGATKATDLTQLFFRYDFFDEFRAGGQGLIGWYVIRIKDPSAVNEVCRTIDALFANSPAETKTQPEKAFLQGFANQVGNVGAIMTAVVTAVFFTMLLVAGNTMAQAVRERTGELAVLKTLGFRDRQILGLVLLESLAVAVIGGGLGLLVGWLAISRGDPTKGLLPAFFLPPRDLAIGIFCTVALGLVAGILPAHRAMRLKIADALRRV